MEATTIIQAIHAILTSKYVGPLLVISTLFFSVNALSRINRIENVDLPEIRQDIKEIKQDIVDIKIRLTRVETRLDNIEEDIREIKADIREMKADIKTLLARKN